MRGPRQLPILKNLAMSTLFLNKLYSLDWDQVKICFRPLVSGPEKNTDKWRSVGVFGWVDNFK